MRLRLRPAPAGLRECNVESVTLFKLRLRLMRRQLVARLQAQGDAKQRLRECTLRCTRRRGLLATASQAAWIVYLGCGR